MIRLFHVMELLNQPRQGENTNKEHLRNIQNGSAIPKILKGLNCAKAQLVLCWKVPHHTEKL